MYPRGIATKEDARNNVEGATDAAGSTDVADATDVACALAVAGTTHVTAATGVAGTHWRLRRCEKKNNFKPPWNGIQTKSRRGKTFE